MIPRPWPEANCRWPVSVLLLQRFFWRLSDLQHCGVPPEEISMAFSEHLFSFPPGNHWATSKIQHYSALDVFWTLTSWCFKRHHCESSKFMRECVLREPTWLGCRGRSWLWPRGPVGWWPPGSLRSTPRRRRKRSKRSCKGGVLFFTRKIWEFQWWFFWL